MNDINGLLDRLLVLDLSEVGMAEALKQHAALITGIDPEAVPCRAYVLDGNFEEFGPLFASQ